MSPVEWGVIAAGVAAIFLVNWYFFAAGRSAPPAPAVSAAGDAISDDQVQEATITVRGGYQPAAVRVKHGRPVRLVFDRQETSGCSEEVVLADFGIRKFLPPFTKTTVQIMPPRPGTYEFTCGMSMLRGRIVAE